MICAATAAVTKTQLRSMPSYDTLTSPSARSGSRLSSTRVHHLVTCLPSQNCRVIAVSNARDGIDAIEKEGNDLLVPAGSTT